MTNITFPLTAHNVAQVVAERDAEIERLDKIIENQGESIEGLQDEIERLRALVKEIADREVAALAAADCIRTAQRAYMADRGNEDKGRQVADAAAAYDAIRSLKEQQK